MGFVLKGGKIHTSVMKFKFHTMHIPTELILEIEKMQSVLTELKESMLHISD